MKANYKLVKFGENFELHSDDKIFGIEDYHVSGDYTGPMQFLEKDALKLQRFLNVFYKG